MVRRRWIAGSLLLLAAPGCHLGERPPAAAPRAEPLVSQVDAQAARFVAQHNQNAALILQGAAATAALAFALDGLMLIAFGRPRSG